MYSLNDVTPSATTSAISSSTSRGRVADDDVEREVDHRLALGLRAAGVRARQAATRRPSIAKSMIVVVPPAPPREVAIA